MSTSPISRHARTSQSEEQIASTQAEKKGLVQRVREKIADRYENSSHTSLRNLEQGKKNSSSQNSSSSKYDYKPEGDSTYNTESSKHIPCGDGPGI